MHIRTKLLLGAIVLLAVVTFVIPQNWSSQTTTKPNTSNQIATEPSHMHMQEASSSPNQTSPNQTSTGLTPTSKSFTVIVSRRGFNGTNKPLLLNFVQGDVVHITFLYGDSPSADDNPHVIFLEGYDLRTSVISKAKPSAALDFIATETGTFAFYCVIECSGMTNLSFGRMEVRSAKTGSLSTKLRLMVHDTPVQGSPTTLMSVLTQDSKPVSNARIDFYVNTTLGTMKVATALTDQKGIATIDYSFISSGNISVKVKYAGSESLAASNQQVNITVAPHSTGPVLVKILPEPAGMESISTLPYVQGQNWVLDFRLVGVPLSHGLPLIGLILLVIGSVWTIYGYVFTQLRAIMRGSQDDRIKEQSS